MHQLSLLMVTELNSVEDSHTVVEKEPVRE